MLPAQVGRPLLEMRGFVLKLLEPFDVCDLHGVLSGASVVAGCVKYCVLAGDFLGHHRLTSKPEGSSSR